MNQEPHVDTTPLTFLIQIISLGCHLRNERNCTWVHCFTGLLPASLLMFSTLFRHCNFHVSVHCHFFSECMLSAHLYCTDTFLRSEDTVTKAINKVSSLPCNLHAMIADIMCPKGYVLDKII